ncbi:MAG: ribonuclease D [Alphaproteobacteria bacterium]|nr:ribonuclease D [Alphaproteobacteria bacterium]
MPIIKDSKSLATYCQTLAKNEFITIDTEFLREKTYYPKLCLIQLSGPDKQAKAVDPLDKSLDLSPLFELLQNKNVLKVFHSARQDLEIFYNLTGKVVSPIFDTQIAAMVCGYGDSIGYENIVRQISGGQIDKSSQFTDWSLRPLSDKQIDYALGDVIHLVDVYLSLKKELEKRGRINWVFQEEEILNDPATYRNDPEKAWERIKIRSPKPKSLALLRALAAWREKQAQKKDIPKNWVMRDDALVDMANQAPRNVKQLAKIRNVSKDLAESKTGEQLLKVIAEALETPKETWPQPENRKILSPEVIATIDVLKMLLKVQSAMNDVAPKIIASADDLEAIAQNDNADVPALKGWRREVFGKDALAIKHGKLAIGMRNGTVVKFELGDKVG